MFAMDIIESLPWMFIALGFLLSQKKLRISGVRASIISGLYLIKIFGTFCLQWIYTYHYTERATADIYRFFDDGILLRDLLFTNTSDFINIILGFYEQSYTSLYFDKMNSWIKPYESGLYNDNIVMIKMNSLFSLVTNGRFESNAILFSTFAFIGLILLTKTFSSERKVAFGVIGIVSLLPSYLLLQSGGLKESVLLFGIGLFFYSFIGLLNQGKRQLLSLFALSILVLYSIKPYFLVSFAPAIITYFLLSKARISEYFSWPMWCSIVVVGLVMTQALGFEIIDFVIRKQHDFLNHSAEINPGSAIEMERLGNSTMEVLLETPTALFRVLFEPLPWTVNSFSTALMSLENLVVILIILLFAIKLFNGKSVSPYSTMVLQGVLPGIILIGLISPVLGATMRYRAPFLIMLLLILIPTLLANDKKERA